MNRPIVDPKHKYILLCHTRWGSQPQRRNANSKPVAGRFAAADDAGAYRPAFARRHPPPSAGAHWVGPKLAPLRTAAQQPSHCHAVCTYQLQ
uniref:Uncharacterized protein n=1 Tax=Plectus sambesii TaxID=2011161 RepID=A0A914XLC5_9BILA